VDKLSALDTRHTARQKFGGGGQEQIFEEKLDNSILKHVYTVFSAYNWTF